MQSKENVWKMFDAISSTYDLNNRILSLGIDRFWRKALFKHVPTKCETLLDLASGTGDQIFSLMDRSQKIKKAIGLDLATAMLQIAEKKLQKKAYKTQVEFKEGNACDINLSPNSVNCVTMSFGIRNVPSVETCINECFRVLEKQGRLLILEFSLPKNILLKKLHLFYLRKILPRIGGMIAKNRDAYDYLNQTIETFPYGDNFLTYLKNAGFNNAQAFPLSGGIATLYIGDKC